MEGTMNELEQKIREQLGDPDGCFPKTWTFSNNGKTKMNYVMEFEYRRKNKEGNFQKKKSKMSVAIAYNPWNGKKIEDESE